MSAISTDVASQVRQALLDDPRTKDEVIEVSTMSGIVTLSGQVKSVRVSEAAEEIARQQPGVVSVVNELKTG
jgi:osmotically-inducible protein OsmY